MDIVDIKSNLQEVELRICDACLRSGRNREDVTLIAVSKTKPIEMIKECINYGINVYGENKVQELNEKQAQLGNNLHWNFIGHLQRNKVKYIIENVELIHSVDSIKLAEAINNEAQKKNVICNILIEVNIAGEDTKYGVTPENACELVRQIAVFDHLKIKGLMCIAPYVDNPEKNRVYFVNLRELLVDIKNKNIDNVDMDVLSMGMTGDYEVAVEEGATLIRVGTGIFGARNYL